MKKRLISIGCLCAAILIMSGITSASPVPDTGQTKCYDVAGNVISCPQPGAPLYGQYANYSVNPISYTKLDSGGNALPDTAASWSMVKDNVTGLIWEMKTSSDGIQNYNDPHDADNTYVWYDSNPATNGGNAGTSAGDGKDTEAFIKSLNDANFGGFSDWRLPTITELAFLIDFSVANPGVPLRTSYFPGIIGSWYWSSSTVSNDVIRAWDIDFTDTLNYDDDKGSMGHVMAVRGGNINLIGSIRQKLSGNAVAAATSHFTDNGDGTITDNLTGLMWEKSAPGNGMSWESALSYCESLDLGGHTDWRLPTIKESWSIVDYGSDNPAIDSVYFPGTETASYWTSTTFASDTGHGWAMDCKTGYNFAGSKTYYGFVRAVRGGLTVIGASAGFIQSDVLENQRIDLQINSTNVYGQVPVHQWLLLTSASGGKWSPLYVVSNKGLFNLNEVLTDINNDTFSFNSGGVTEIGPVAMADLGLKSGDILAYAYAFQDASGNTYLDNIVMITVK